MASSYELALDTFGDVSHDEQGQLQHESATLRELVEQAVRADEVGVDYIGLGEHHRDDFAVSAPEIVLAAMAARTQRIRLGTAVTVLSSDDPVRLFQRFATLQALAPGRAEVTLGRGSFIESFSLFGLDLDDYERLFEEKLDLFATLLQGGPVQWKGSIRPPLQGQVVYPRLTEPLRTWVGVGGTPASVLRAVRYRMPMMLAIIGGAPGRFRPLVDLYLDACRKQGHAPGLLGVHSQGHVADSDEQAIEEAWPYFRKKHERIGGERGWPPMTKDQFLAEVRHGSVYVGSPETVAQRIAQTMRTLSLDRFELKYVSGPMPHSMLMRSITLYGSEVKPRVLALLG